MSELLNIIIMMNMTNTSVNNTVKNSFRYIIIEDDIMYDNDDYGVYGAVLYDTVDKKIVTTKYGHGVDMEERSSSVDLGDIQKNKKEIMEQMISVMLNETPVVSDSVLENIALCSSEENPTAIPVNVVRGRKFKGFGYLVYAVSYMSRFGNVVKPVIIDPATGDIHLVNSFGYLEYDDEFCNSFKNLIVERLDVNESTVYSLGHLWAYEMSYSSCDSVNYRNRVKSLGNTGAKGIKIPEIVKLAINANIAKRELANSLKREALKKEKMPAIIEWVKNNTDKKTEEDIMNLAEHIFNKKY